MLSIAMPVLPSLSHFSALITTLTGVCVSVYIMCIYALAAKEQFSCHANE